MALQDDITAKLAELNSPQNVQGRGGVRWGYDPERRAWFTEGDQSLNRGGRYYQNTTMGLPESVAGEGRTVSEDGNVLEPGRGGGLLHGNQRWSNTRGEFYTPFSFDKLATYGVLGALTAGTANAVMAGGAGAAAGGGTAAGGLLPSATIPAATGLTTGAGATAAAGTGAGMGVMSWLDPILRYVVPTAGGLVGNQQQNAANDRATQAQMDYYNRALAAAEEEQRYRRQFDEDQRAYDRKRLEDDLTYRRGTDARDFDYRKGIDQRDYDALMERQQYGREQFGSYLGRLEPFRVPATGAVNRMEGLLTGTQQMPQQSSGRMVRLQGPDGSTRDIPESQASLYERAGARRV